MDIHDSLISSVWVLISQIIFWPFFVYACWTAPWYKLNNKMKHIWPGLCVGFLFLWQIKASLTPGISIHLLGTTLMTLLFGWQFAIIGLTVVLTGSTFIMHMNQVDCWQATALNGIICILIPVLVSYHLVRLIFKHLPHNFFIYIFLSGFANAMVTLGIVGLSSTLILFFASTIDVNILFDQYLPAFLLIIFPEAFITGGILTMFVVYRPQWVLSFDDALYLKKK